MKSGKQFTHTQGCCCSQTGWYSLEEGMKMSIFYINFGDVRAHKGCGQDDVNMWVYNVLSKLDHSKSIRNIINPSLV